ncbi:TIGR03862 family flavoprotein [Kordiimonas aquimaris]|uniref:TIGR03862 family flavoprotein n=1 Tax=Kordiimonas aquimaris TaxID=707591 RepID=UPI0021D36F05|nr:TIGR03862 family flavoprotein [Kordiimonas aquimaris]
MNSEQHNCDIAIIGGGPAGLSAAEIAATAGLKVHIYERMPTPARKFLMAGKSGLNITHSENYNDFTSRYGTAQKWIQPALDKLTPQDITSWMHELGIDPFTGSSGRIFPKTMKASPLLRNWLSKLDALGVKLYTRHTWTGWKNSAQLCFSTPDNKLHVNAKATILALGGTSWPKLGSVGEWTNLLTERNVSLSPFEPTNCGFNVGWSDHFKTRFAGSPVKNVMTHCGNTLRKGDFVITANGVEGSLIYTVSSALREQLKKDEPASLTIDLAPDYSSERLIERLKHPRGKHSISNHIRKRIGIDGVKLGLLYEFASAEAMKIPAKLVENIKALSITIDSPRPIEEAISVAGGVKSTALNGDLMIDALPGVFSAGEMNDWEAPTGGYLLSACLAQGHQAARGAIEWVNNPANNRVCT